MSIYFVPFSTRLSSSFVFCFRAFYWKFPCYRPLTKLWASIGPPAFCLTPDSPHEEITWPTASLTTNSPALPVPSLEILNQSACKLPPLRPFESAPTDQPLTSRRTSDRRIKSIWQVDIIYIIYMDELPGLPGMSIHWWLLFYSFPGCSQISAMILLLYFHAFLTSPEDHQWKTFFLLLLLADLCSLVTHSLLFGCVVTLLDGMVMYEEIVTDSLSVHSQHGCNEKILSSIQVFTVPSLFYRCLTGVGLGLTQWNQQ